MSYKSTVMKIQWVYADVKMAMDRAAKERGLTAPHQRLELLVGLINILSSEARLLAMKVREEVHPDPVDDEEDDW